MAPDIRFQCLVLPNKQWDPLLERFRLVEELGFDIATTGDHWCDWSNPPADWLELWTTLAGVAQGTDTIRLAPGVAQIPLRNPAMLARQALTVDHISGGRLEVGLGLGLPIDPSYDMIGMENWDNPKRVRRFTEYVEIVDALLTNPVTTYEGEHYQVHDATMNPQTPQRPRPPITIAALGPQMVRKAARMADAWNTMSFAADFDTQLAELEVSVGVARAECDRIGRDPDSLRISFNFFDPGSRASGGQIHYYESADRFVEMVHRSAALGVSEFGMYFPMLDEQLAPFEAIARDVFPALRAELDA